LPPRTETDRPRVVERAREKEILKRRLASLAGAAPEVQEAIAAALRHFNGTPGVPRSFDDLDALIDRQAYRLSYWRVAAEEINYRRFFDVNELAAIRMERPEVFEATHQLLLRLLAEGNVRGLRIDHPDGLWDPAGYFARLQESYATVVAQRSGISDQEGTQKPHSSYLIPGTQPLYVVVEKILGRGERLPKDWAVSGTTGYEFMNSLNGIFVDTSAEKRFSELYSTYIGERQRFDDLVYNAKMQIMRTALASELNVLAYQLNHISEHNRYYRDFTLNSLHDALREVIACFPIYRTYVLAEHDQVEERDRAAIETAIATAQRRNPADNPSIYEFVRDILLLRYPETLDPAARDHQRTFVMKFQQYTGPVMAKGVEDTAFYRYNRLVSLNEVGGEPQRFGISLAEFHRQNAERLREWPGSLLATSTHDTKRSEDVRARINVLSELPDEWRKALTRWSRLNRSKKTIVDGRLAPDRNEEYLLYQTLLGVWPFDQLRVERLERSTLQPLVERIQQYMVKAIREAKVNASWLNPNTNYDDAVRAFVAAILDPQQSSRFLSDFLSLQQKVAHYGAFNSLAQTLLKLTVPGVPDIYQGNEMWDLSLVDPDNRRPVDYDLRAWLLGELLDWPGERTDLARMLTDNKHDGRIKLYLTQRALAYRHTHADLFGSGTYTPLAASADANDNVVAFARTIGDHEVLVVAPRLLGKRLHDAYRSPLGREAWGDALLLLPAGKAQQRYRNIFTGEVVAAIEREAAIGLPLAEVFAHFPVAMFERVNT
jgi:(1->4)-alpha-D-glucan 1-alpha-D-glucosylmutase